jgi:hypothetical protein
MCNSLPQRSLWLPTRDMFDLLLAHGADPNLPSREGDYVLWPALKCDVCCSLRGENDCGPCSSACLCYGLRLQVHYVLWPTLKRAVSSGLCLDPPLWRCVSVNAVSWRATCCNARTCIHKSKGAAVICWPLTGQDACAALSSCCARQHGKPSTFCGGTPRFCSVAAQAWSRVGQMRTCAGACLSPSSC